MVEMGFEIARVFCKSRLLDWALESHSTLVL